MTDILGADQRELVRLEREKLAAVLAELERWDLEIPGLDHLAETIAGLEGLFLLVVTGEFNSGKSALINALLGDRYLEEGVTPTTRSVQVLQFGPLEPPVPIDDHWRRTIPSDLLREMQIVDTPGTNAIMRHHEALTKEYVPRADLVMFVTSADRPFSESERAFLELIRQWGKKIVFVVNKIDLLQTDAEKQKVVAFVRDGARTLLDSEPHVFGLSARHALDDHAGDEESQQVARYWQDFVLWVGAYLATGQKFRLKLENPIGVAEKVIRDTQDRVGAREAVLDADRKALDEALGAISSFEERALRDLDERLNGIDNQVMAVRERAEAFLDETFRIARLRDLLSEERLQAMFEEKVVAGTPDEIESEVSAIIDWLVEEEHRQWTSLVERLDSSSAGGHDLDSLRPSGFAARRRELLDQVGRHTDEVVSRFDPSGEAARLALSVQDTLTKTALVEAGAIGLGLVLKAVLVSAAADATGILAAGVVAVLGLTLLPHRRRKAAESLRNRTSQVREELRASMSEAVEHEISEAAEQMRSAVRPYDEFLTEEHDHLKSQVQVLDHHLEELVELRRQVSDLAGGSSSPA